MSRSLTTAVALVAALSCSSLLADGLFLNGVSPRSIGRGGTNQGFADNGAIILDNPAAMTNIEGRGLFDAGVDVLFTDFHYSDPLNARVSDSSATPLPQVSGIYRTDDGMFAFGLGLFVPAGFSQQYDMNGPFPFFGPQHYESYGSLVKILPAVACRLTENLSIGGTVGVAFSQIRLQGPYFLQSLGVPTLTELNVEGQGLTGSLGLQYLLTDSTTLGLTWQTQTNMNLHGDTNVYLPFGVASHYDARLRIQWPQSLAFGVRQQIAQRHVVSADVVWLNWSDSFDTAVIKLSTPSSPFFPPTVNDPFWLSWTDTVSVRLGYELDLGENRTLRLGYVHHPSPIPNSTLTPFIQAITEHAVSAGYGFRVMGWDVDMAYMFTGGPSQRVGTSAFIGGDFSNSTHSAQTHASSISLIKRF